MQPLEGLLVVAIEQAVAAPLCTARLCEAGARVIKIERPTGDFARGYDSVAHGDSSYFIWLNQNKESLVLDFKQADDAALLHRILRQADVVVQNLAPGALPRAGFASAALREQYPRLITCDISGYGNSPAVAGMKAYDFLVQAESGLVSISGGRQEPGRIGVSLCDIGAGMAAHAGILEALLLRAANGRGSGLAVSLFGVAADWMTVPLLHCDYAGKAPERTGLHHPSIAPYGGYAVKHGEVVIVAVQNEREWRRFCATVLARADLAASPLFADNRARVKNRTELDRLILHVSQSLSREDFIQRLKQADIAYGAVNSVADFSAHAGLHRRSVGSSSGGSVKLAQRPIVATYQQDADCRADSRAPTIGQHTQALRDEFAG